jgi:hypothetical protein
MRQIECTIPIAGRVYVTLDVGDNATEEEVYIKACEVWGEMTDEDRRQALEWEFYRYITQGNVLYPDCNEFEITYDEVIDED